MTRGVLLWAEDQGTIWRVFYQAERRLHAITFDHRPFADFYEGVTERNFYQDYAFGAGREYVSRQLRGLSISVNEEAAGKVVRLED